MNVTKNARQYGIYYNNKKSESEIEIFFEINEYYVDKAGKYYRN
jgi:hypothetical protein